MSSLRQDYKQATKKGFVATNQGFSTFIRGVAKNRNIKHLHAHTSVFSAGSGNNIALFAPRRRSRRGGTAERKQ